MGRERGFYRRTNKNLVHVLNSSYDGNQSVTGEIELCVIKCLANCRDRSFTYHCLSKRIHCLSNSLYERSE